MFNRFIKIRGARVHNLKNINVEIPREKLVVFTGISGSGKSSLAFDTIYAEGQRRYVESLSTYARQFLGLMDKPEVDAIEGLSPAISIDQRSAGVNPRSTVGTITEIYDYLRLLFSRIGIVHCPNCGKKLFKQNSSNIITEILNQVNEKQKILFLAPITISQQNSKLKNFLAAKLSGLKLFRINGEIRDLEKENLKEAELKGIKKAEIVVAELVYNTKEKELFKEGLSRFVELGLDLGNSQLLVVFESKDGKDKSSEIFFCQHYICPDCKIPLSDLEPRNFSFNSPAGACPKCLGLGTRLEVDPNLVIPNKKLTLAQGAIKPWARNFSNQNSYWQLLEAVAKKNNFSLGVPVADLSQKAIDLIFKGSLNVEYEINGKKMIFPGVLAILTEKYQQTASDYLKNEIEQYMRVFICPDCRGKRLKPVFLAVTVGGLNISAITSQMITNSLSFFENLLKDKNGKDVLSSRDHKIADQAIKEIINHLKYLENVGLSYLTLDRSSTTLSGGEAQRIRLATQLGLSLTGVVYILDEPSIGLHQKDNQKLIDTLKHLR